MEQLKHSLYEIKKEGCPVSYIKGIEHGTNNVCNFTIIALFKSSVYYHETSFLLEETNVYSYKKPFSSEFLLNRLAIKYSIPIKIHLDGFAKKSLLKTYEYMGKNFKTSDNSNIPTEYSVLKDDDIDFTTIFPFFKEHPKMYKYGLLKRNNIWMKLIKLLINKKGSFICCGLAHVPDLLFKLKKEGFTIRPIKQGKIIDPKDINFEVISTGPKNDILGIKI
jgi:hypothetical protein